MYTQIQTPRSYFSMHYVVHLAGVDVQHAGAQTHCMATAGPALEPPAGPCTVQSMVLFLRQSARQKPVPERSSELQELKHDAW